ncbi:MAG TPA: anti-sigma factor [Pyrinomonadaceae bacterium]|nr:anti-sigma factor [Pyrinomonadaceae bacterium]
MLAVLALSALDAVDERALSQHLSECAECRRELADWESTAAALALSAPPAEPSPQVRDQIMSAVRSDAQKQSTQSRVVEFPQSRRERWTAFGNVGAIAAAVLFLMLIIWILVLWQQNRALRRESDMLARQMQSIQEETARANELVSILSSPGARFRSLSGTGPGVGATAQLAYDGSGRALLMANALPPAPRGKQYQLWFIVGNNPPIPGQTFSPDEMGKGELRDEVPERALDSAVFAITLEPAGGSTAPTSAIYLRSGL